MKTKILMYCMLTAGTYISCFFIPHTMIYTTAYLCISLIPMIYALMLWYIVSDELPVSTAKYHPEINLPQMIFLGKSTTRLLLSWLFLGIVLLSGYGTPVWISANGFINPRVSITLIFVIVTVSSILFQMLRKETRFFFKKIAYKKKMQMLSLAMCLLWISLSFGKSFSLWIFIGIGLFLGLASIVYIRQMYCDSHIIHKPNYHDAFKKPQR